MIVEIKKAYAYILFYNSSSDSFRKIWVLYCLVERNCSPSYKDTLGDSFNVHNWKSESIILTWRQDKFGDVLVF